MNAESPKGITQGVPACGHNRALPINIVNIVNAAKAVNVVRRERYKCSLDVVKAVNVVNVVKAAKGTKAVNVGRAVNSLLGYFRYLAATYSRIHEFTISREHLCRSRRTIVTTFTVFTAFTAPAFAAAECRVIDPELQGSYEGGCKRGLAHGYGVAKGSAEYTGEFYKGLKDGKGVKTWAWGDRYEGDFLDDRRHGKGMYVWGAGSPWAGERFVGDYVADQREGRGAYYWPNGDRFEGVWKEDRRFGYSAMELRRQAAAVARTGALKAGMQVCSWGQTGIAYKVLRVGTIETMEANVLQVRLVRLEGVPQAISGSNLQPGMLLNGTPGDWTPCS